MNLVIPSSLRTSIARWCILSSWQKVQNIILEKHVVVRRYKKWKLFPHLPLYCITPYHSTLLSLLSFAYFYLLTTFLSLYHIIILSNSSPTKFHDVYQENLDQDPIQPTSCFLCHHWNKEWQTSVPEAMVASRLQLIPKLNMKFKIFRGI